MGAMWDWITTHWDEEWARFVEGLLLLLVAIVLAGFVRRTARNQLKRTPVDPQVILLVSRVAYLAPVLLGIIAFFTPWFGNSALVFGGVGVFALAVSLSLPDNLQT